MDNSRGKHAGSEASEFRSRALTGSGEPSGEPEGLVINTADLFKGAQEVRIKHNDTFYRLRRTRFGKLLLTK